MQAKIQILEAIEEEGKTTNNVGKNLFNQLQKAMVFVINKVSARVF